MDFREQIRAHPWGAVAFAALAGVWLASHGESKREQGIVMGLVSALALQLVRDTVVKQMSKIAKSWMAEAPPPQPTVATPYAQQ